MNILYIHGYGGTGNSRTAQALKTYLPEDYNVFEPCFPLDPVKALKLAEKTIRKKEIDIVVASSLGAFTALQLYGIPKIVINPCLYPSKEIPKQSDISADILTKFAKIEKRISNLHYVDNRTIGVFSTKDELFSYQDEFFEHSFNIQTIEDTHRISVENVEKTVAPLIIKMANAINSINQKAIDKVYEILKNAISKMSKDTYAIALCTTTGIFPEWYLELYHNTNSNFRKYSKREMEEVDDELLQKKYGGSIDEYKKVVQAEKWIFGKKSEKIWKKEFLNDPNLSIIGWLLEEKGWRYNHFNRDILPDHFMYKLPYKLKDRLLADNVLVEKFGKNIPFLVIFDE